MIRLIAHLFGWHTNACRGRTRCEPDCSRCNPDDHRWGWYR